MTLCDEFQHLKKRSLPEWQALISDIRSRTREQVQQHGELSALAGFVVGVLLVLFFRFFCWVFFILFLISAAVWLLAPEGES